MTITKESCITLLHNQFISDFSQIDNVSKLTKDSRWENKQECLSYFDNSPRNIRNDYLEEWKTTEKEWKIEESKTEEKTHGKENNFMASIPSLSFENFDFNNPLAIVQTLWVIWKRILVWLFTIILFSIFVRMMRTFLRYLYWFCNSQRLIFLKVLLPRWDWKSDREQEKEIAKDMKEKIWRMSQVLWNLHKMSEVSTYEKLMQTFFWKQKLVFIYQYENWEISCLVWTYPEYQEMVESAIASQYSAASIERVARPKFFRKKHSDIQILETQKDPLYTIKLYKNIPDDPINNILDSMGKVSPEDTVSIVIVSKPEGSAFNSRREIAADRLYKNLDLYEMRRWHRKNLINPFKWIEFAIFWTSNKLISSKKEEKDITMVRMVKAKEDSRNAMWEEAANPTFRSTISIIASSNVKWRPKEIINNLESAYNVYKDEYSNSLECSNLKHDIFWFLYKPLRTAWVNMYLAWFFSKYSYFSTNELCSLFHFPDGLYNRSPAIEWMQYKVIAPPSNLPSFSDDEWNGKVVSWVLAEKYKNWNLSAILDDYPHHWAVWTKTEEVEELKPLNECNQKEKQDHNIIGNTNSISLRMISESETLESIADCARDWKYNITEQEGIYYMKIKTEEWDKVKPISEFSDEEMKKNNIVERDGMIYYRTIKENETIKPISECSNEEKEKNGIVEKEDNLFLKIKKEKTVKWYKTYKWWVLLWVNIYRNVYSPVYIKRDDRTRHHYCIWKSGTWKSVFLQTIARQDIWNGDGICLIDPHGDLAEDMLAYIPKERAKDVVYFEAWDEERPMWLNLYEIDNLDQADRTVNDATEIFLKMFGPEIFWPRIQEYFKYGSLTLLEDFEDRPTLLDVTRLFTDDWYREFKLKKVTNAVVRNWWEKTYNSMWDREKQEIIPYFSSKFVSFNTNRLIRNIIWQTKSAFKFDDIMNNQKILLINLSKGKIWEMNAQLLGMIIVSKVYNAAMARASIPEKDRKDFYLYVDEFQNFVSWTIGDILSEARKYRLGLIMAHQYIAQLDPAKWLGDAWGWKSDVKAAVFGNVGTMMSFKVGAPDAEFLEKEYSPVLSGQDIVWIANYKSYIKLNIDNATTRVFSMNSIYTRDYQNKKIVPILKEYSAKKYGRRREFVDAETRSRLWLGIDETDLPSNSINWENWENTENSNNEWSEE